MALGIWKNADLWRWEHGKLPYYGVGNPQNTRFMAL